MDTTIITLTDVHQKIGDKGAWSCLQNIGQGDCVVYIGATAPADGAAGFILRVLDGMNPATWGDENVYARKANTSTPGKIAILK
jgi:hypothetical protein